MSNANFLRKAEVLANGDYDLYRKSLQTQIAFFRGGSVSMDNPFSTLKDAVNFHNQLLSEKPENFLECERLENARVQRVVRLKKRIRYMVENYDCCFVTLTFRDDVLVKTNADTRHRYVHRWLHDNFCCGVANVDFGAKNHREHYHAVVPVSRVQHDTWSYGALYGKSIPCGSRKDADKISCYVAKLVNHAIKETTCGCRTIYSGSFGDLSLPLERSKTRNKGISIKNGKSVYGWSANDVHVDADGFIVMSDEECARLEELFGL